MGAYAQSVWQHRYFWGSLVRMDLRTRYHGTWLGAGWSLLHPLAMSAVLCMVFHKLFGLSIRDFLPMLMAGIVLWQYFLTCVITGCLSLTQGEPYLRQFSTPAAIFALRTVLVATVHLAIGLAVVFVGNMAINGLEHPLSVLGLLPMFPLLLITGWSVAVLIGFAQLYFADVRYIAEITMQMLFFCTPIIYPPAMLRERGVGWLLAYNPVAPFIEAVRMPLLGRGLPSWDVYAIVLGFSCLVAAGAIFTLATLEKKVVLQL